MGADRRVGAPRGKFGGNSRGAGVARCALPDSRSLAFAGADFSLVAKRKCRLQGLPLPRFAIKIAFRRILALTGTKAALIIERVKKIHPAEARAAGGE